MTWKERDLGGVADEGVLGKICRNLFGNIARARLQTCSARQNFISEAKKTIY